MRCLWLASLFSAPAFGAAPASSPAHDELTIVPLVGGNSDVGFGAGYLMSYARLSTGYRPYLWRLESAGFVTFKTAHDGDGVQMPYLDDYLLLHLPHALRGTLQLRLGLSYTRETNLKFVGLGNASQLTPGLALTHRYYEHSRTHPTLRWTALYHASDTVDFSWGAAYTHNWLDVPSETLLAQKMRTGTPDERSLLGSALPGSGLTQGDLLFSLGTAYDTRDSDLNPRSGQYHTLRTDLAPGGAREIPNRWARVLVAGHGYVPLVPQRLTLALRVTSELLLGHAPFYELPRYDDSYFGGGHGVRGVPGQRYWGKVKVLSNIELRSELLPIRFWKKRNVLGVTAFFDTGRLWAGFSSRPDLDGESPGLKFGSGVGVRLVAGDSFVVRADVAYSPDAQPIGAYLTSGHMF